MTTSQKKEKLDSIKTEIQKIEFKIDKLLLQRENLKSAYEKVQAVVPKDPTPVSLADREKQSQKDKELFEMNLKRGPQIKRLQFSAD